MLEWDYPAWERDGPVLDEDGLEMMDEWGESGSEYERAQAWEALWEIFGKEAEKIIWEGAAEAARLE